MDEETFWELVDEARAEAGSDDELFLRTLQSGLLELPPNAIEGFRDRLDEMLARAYRWDLWAAAYIINGGCSDDAFEYFRGWLVSRGRVIFEAALLDPETLSGLVPADPDWVAEFEEILYLPVYTLEQKTGQEVPLPDPLEAPENTTEPEGEPWDEQSVDSLFPALSRQASERLSQSRGRK